VTFRGLRNWDNEDHVRELAELWNVEPHKIPRRAPPTHAMQIFRYAEQGSIELLWISATNPAVSLPNLARVRDILARPELFVVVQDLFLTETAEYADVVLPAATWGEKTGTFTSVDRTVHLSEKGVEPPDRRSVTSGACAFARSCMGPSTNHPRRSPRPSTRCC
jgi:anaerobic selenocysteine-containing dehydrogenase